MEFGRNSPNGTPIAWLRRIRFRAQLREMLNGPSYLLTDVGFEYWDARAEVKRRFWQSVDLKTGNMESRE